MKKLAPGGASDIAGALIQAAQRVASSKNRQNPLRWRWCGHVGRAQTREHRGALEPHPHSPGRRPTAVWCRPNLDEVTLSALAQALGGTYERVGTGEPLVQRAQAIALSIRAPVLVAPRVESSNGSLGDLFPKKLPNLRIGQGIIVLGKAAGAQTVPVTLQGQFKGQPYALQRTFALPTSAAGQNPLVPRLWAEQQIRSLEASTDNATHRAVLDLSRRFHVMSRYTSLLVLENDRMFAEFGIERTTHQATDQSDGQFIGRGGAGGPGHMQGGLANLSGMQAGGSSGASEVLRSAPAADMPSRGAGGPSGAGASPAPAMSPPPAAPARYLDGAPTKTPSAEVASQTTGHRHPRCPRRPSPAPMTPGRPRARPRSRGCGWTSPRRPQVGGSSRR